MTINQRIESVWAPDPPRETDYADGASVGSDGITRIEYREQNMGSYGIGWYDAYRGDVAVKSFNALSIAIVCYFAPEQVKEAAE